MKTILIASLLVLLAVPPPACAAGSAVTEDEALTVARNWVALLAEAEGSWAGTDAPEVTGVRDLRRGERQVGYYCPVAPRGFVVVPLVKGLAPVKAYSDECGLDPESEVGPTDLLTGRMAVALDAIEAYLGPLDAVDADALRAFLTIDHTDSWEDLLGGFGAIDRNYQTGDVLLTSMWHQFDPYNQHCPPGSGCDHTLVGCVATAAAQIMHYWSWPPYGELLYTDPYDWPNMPDEVTASSPPEVIDAVAELCAEVGDAIATDYGCGESSAFTWMLEGAFEVFFRYDPACGSLWHKDYDAIAWFGLIKDQLNVNRPIEYEIWIADPPDTHGHVIVVDGWREIGGVPERQYHMNYGWQDTTANRWYVLDGLPGTIVDKEYMLLSILPDPAMGGSVQGTFSVPPPLPVRYFDVDVVGANATFLPGHYLQFLQDITLGCAEGFVRFDGVPGIHTRLYTNGDTSKGIRIHAGAVKLSPGGEMAFRWRE